MKEISGSCDARFSAVEDLFRENLENGTDVGASVAVFLAGEPVVDLWGGHFDAARTRPWQRDTLTNVFSTTKTVTALCALVLADRGLLDLDAAVARYWPEFAQAGKENVLVRHLLAHSAGLPAWDEPVTFEDVYDWQKSTALLARQAPRWEPGTASGYHGYTQGHLIGEVVRRITGLSLGTFLSREIVRPLGADFHIGLPRHQHPRVSPVIPPPVIAEGVPMDHPMVQALNNPPIYETGHKVAWTTEWREAELPAFNGHGNAYSIAAIQSVLAGGGEARGVRLMSEATCDAVFQTQTDGLDRILQFPVRWGLGFALPSDSLPVAPHSRVGFWGGAGGSACLVDLDAGMAFAYVPNRMVDHGATTDDRCMKLLTAAYGALAG